MSRAGRITVYVVTILLLVLVIVAIIAVSAVRRPYPKTRGTLTVPGLQAEVTVIRDAYGVPHIYAANDHDLYFAQGYTHAQDRFFQMEFNRRVGMGRLSEMVGEATLETDRFIRNIGWNRAAAMTVAATRRDEPEVWAALEAYAAGVNAWLAQNGENVALNATLLGLVNGPWTIEPWQPVDTVAWGIVMSWQLSGNMESELDRVALMQTLPAPTVAALFPPYPADRPIIAPTVGQGQGAPAAPVAADWSRVSTAVIGRIPPNLPFGSGDAVGSNNWVVSGDHTASGRPLLANDPHLGVQMPSIWYLNGLHAPGHDVVGFSFPGSPYVIIGANNNIAWGVTTLVNDSQDLFIEKINPDNPLQYEYDGAWRDMETLTEVIQVNGGEPVELVVRQTVHGVVINTTNAELTDTMALSWGTLRYPANLTKALHLLNRAGNYDAFRAALSYWDVAAQNVVYADVDGNIAYQSTGRYPVRRAGDGQMPAPGWTGEYDWDGWVAYDAMPAVLNPPEGFIVTANNRLVDDAYPHLISVFWGDGDRAQRIETLLREAIAGGVVSAETLAAIQLDNGELLYDSLRPLFNGLTSPDADVQAAIERLRGWDGQLQRDSVPAALFEVFYMHLAQRVLADELGDAADVYLVNGRTQRLFFHQLGATPNAPWWDDTTTAATESARDSVLLALADTINWFEEHVGGGMNQWTWGAIHQITFREGILGGSGVAPVEAIFNRGPFPVDGGESIVNANAFDWGEVMAEVNWHPSMRYVVDLADVDAAQAVIPTGQSGHPYHRHYADQMPLWLDGAFIPLRLTEGAVTAAEARTLTLRPER